MTSNDPSVEGLGFKVASWTYRLRRRLATGAAVAVVCFLAYHVTFGPNGLTIYQQKRNEDRALHKQILELQQENSRLQEHLQHLRSDPDAIEHEARIILHYAKPGEVIYTLNDKPADPKAASK